MNRSSLIPYPSSLAAVLLVVLRISLVAAQPQSPNFLLSAETFSAAGGSDSSAHFTLSSIVCQWSVADTHASPNYFLTSGFLAPSLGTSAGAFLVVNPLSLDFGEVHVDSTGNRTITLSDTGYWNLRIIGLQLAGTTFRIVPTPIMPDTIYARASRDYALEFHPAMTGVLRDTLTITCDSGNPVRVPLEGTGTAPGIVLDPDTLLYGDLWIHSFRQDTFTVINSGSADLHVDSIATNNPLFPSEPIPFVVPRGSSFAVAYAVSVPDTLNYAAILTAHSDAGDPTVLLAAHGIWTELHANPTSISLGSIAVADTVDTVVTLSSAGNTFIRINSVQLTSNHFTIFRMPADSLPAHGTDSVVLRFVGQAIGDFNDTLVIANSLGSPVRIPLSGGVSAVGEDPNLIPRDFCLDQNFPNPFNPTTTIRFGVPKSAQVRIEIFDILGRHVITLAEGVFKPGWHNVLWDCSSCPTGMYIMRMHTSEKALLRKMLLMK